MKNSLAFKYLLAAAFSLCIVAHASAKACASICSDSAISVDTWTTETGTLTNPLYTHDLAINWSLGGANGNGPQIQCGGTVAATGVACLVSCSVAITFNATGNGVGTTVNFPSGNIWAASRSQTTTCAAKSGPVGSCTSYDWYNTTLWQSSGTTGHKTGAHTAYSTLQSECAYADQGSGGGGPECDGDLDCPGDLCCYSGVCLVCQNQGEVAKGCSASAPRRRQRSVAAADDHHL